VTGWHAVASSLLLLISAGRVAPQAPTFSTRLEAVRVDVLVTDQGQVVRGLTPADFDIRDEGVPQQVDLISFEQIPLNIVLALDTSDSVSGERLDQLRSAGGALVDRLSHDDQAALVTFSQIVALRASLTRDVARLRAAVDQVSPAGNTALVDGTYAAMMLAESDVRRGLVIVFSDGVDTASWLSPERVLDSARRSDAVVYAVVVRGGKSPFLRDLTARSGGGIFEVESTKDLADRFVRILDEFRQRYLVSYSPRGVAKDGWHRIDVRIKGRRTTVRARAGYLSGS
jgi:VWFA-related protein